MNGIEPRAQQTVQSLAIQRGADEIMQLFFAQEEKLKTSILENIARNAPTKVAAMVQTDGQEDSNLKAQLEEAIQKLKDAHIQIEQLKSDIHEKQSAVEKLSSENAELQGVLQALEMAPERVDEDIVMLGSSSTSHGEPDQSFTEGLTLVEDFNADGAFLQPDGIASSASAPPNCEDSEGSTLAATSPFLPVSAVPALELLQSLDNGDSDGSDSDDASDFQSELDRTLEVDQQSTLSVNDFESDILLFPYPVETALSGSDPLEKPTHVFIHAQPRVLLPFRTPASPLRDEEQFEWVDLDQGRDEDSSETED